MPWIGGEWVAEDQAPREGAPPRVADMPLNADRAQFPYSSPEAEFIAQQLAARDFGGYTTDPGRPLMGMFSNAAPIQVNTQPAYGGDLRQFNDTISGRGYSQWPTDQGFVASPAPGYADMGPPEQATGLADWMARSMARGAPGTSERQQLLQFLQASDPMRGMQIQSDHIEPSSFEGAPRTIPWSPDQIAASVAARDQGPDRLTPPDAGGRAPLNFGQVRAPEPGFFQREQAPTQPQQAGPGSAGEVVQPVGGERVPRDIRPAGAQPAPDLTGAIAHLQNTMTVSQALQGLAPVTGYTDPTPEGVAYARVGQPLLNSSGGVAGQLVNVSGQLLVYTPDRGYVPLTDPEFQPYVNRGVANQAFGPVTPRF